MFIPARYKIHIYDTDDNLQYVLSDFSSLSLNHGKNQPSSMTISFVDTEIIRFYVDGRVKVYRSVPDWGIDWYLEWEGLFVGYSSIKKIDMGIYDYTCNFISLEDLLARRVVAYYPESPQSSKYGNIETVVKQLVDENLGPSANSPQRFVPGTIEGFMIEDNYNRGIDVEINANFDNVLSVIKPICDANNIVFEITGYEQDTNKIIFVLREGIYGVNRGFYNVDVSTGINHYGNKVVVFSELFDNVVDLELVDSKENEKNVIYVTGNGTGDDISLTHVTSDDYNSTKYSHKELVVNASGESQENESLDVFADKQLYKNRYRRTISFKPIQKNNYSYGKDYWFGDVIAAKIFDITSDFEIKEVSIEISGDSESIGFTLEEYVNESS